MHRFLHNSYSLHGKKFINYAQVKIYVEQVQGNFRETLILILYDANNHERMESISYIRAVDPKSFSPFHCATFIPFSASGELIFTSNRNLSIGQLAIHLIFGLFRNKNTMCGKNSILRETICTPPIFVLNFRI